MANYTWELYEVGELGDRYPQRPDISGIAAWSQGARLLSSGALTQQFPWLNMISASRPLTPLPCPRVFISHRQSDVPFARRLAYLADKERFDYWLDVVDLPAEKTKQVQHIEAILGRTLTKFEVNVLQAAVIEMALVNCTHVVAVMTSRTAGSVWVPYEYGRVDRRGLAVDPATAYCITTSIKVTDLPEYLHLAPIHKIESEIRAWLKAEKTRFIECAEQEEREGRSEWGGEVPDPL